MQNHEKWLIKAENDLQAAKLLLKAKYLDVAIYHTQQCAEKALKGYLAFQKRPIEKTHDLVALAILCVKLNPKFTALRSIVENLNPFSVAFRYPEVEIHPQNQVVVHAVRDAEKILCFVETQIEAITL